MNIRKALSDIWDEYKSSDPSNATEELLQLEEELKATLVLVELKAHKVSRKRLQIIEENIG